MTSDKGQKAIVIGAGIGGLTAGALLAKRGYYVRVFDSSIVPGGCASTFRRRGFTFDVGATQVAGLEPGGIHHRIFSELGVEVPEARYCDPACAVFLPGETEPINVWRDPDKWRVERQKQFPRSDSFWQLLSTLFQASWRFQSRDPVLPPRNLWDVTELLKAVRPDTLVTVPFTLMTVGDALRLCGVGDSRRLKTFLDLQLKLYSQVGADETALLYAATALGISQSPQGLFHLQGSMQVLSDKLVAALEKHGGELLMQHVVREIRPYAGDKILVTVLNQKTGESFQDSADHIVANVTVQNLVKMVDLGMDSRSIPYRLYRRRVEKLPSPSGAFVVYLGVRQDAIPDNCPPHLQFLYDWDGPVGENNSLFVSVSHPGDGRAPEGMATITASSFTDVNLWTDGDNYEDLKERYTAEAVRKLGAYFRLSPENIVHCEAATPRTFAYYTGRDRGIVGGVGQRISTFGPFGFATRTPIRGLWLVGDSTHPGEGTAGVSYSALTAVRQIENMR
ncbi:C-3',4' desaturase CrtD [[Phormidium] sp. ETS-05]|uniref:C-3',4' desaturase CrtD n=1 Tax=[Phormidium] sp. ETS-05 TaxID=222819 RepID=UPI0018EF21A4|nr:C-3',4' desaturase CrtD [[Phormidium] sp. ETS-05]